jgi:hypothetical protein
MATSNGSLARSGENAWTMSWSWAPHTCAGSSLTYANYYNELRTHRSLTKDTPRHRAVGRLGIVASRPILGGLHHQYCRI